MGAKARGNGHGAIAIDPSQSLRKSLQALLLLRMVADWSARDLRAR
jgi:hypothetical protein